MHMQEYLDVMRVNLWLFYMHCFPKIVKIRQIDCLLYVCRLFTDDDSDDSVQFMADSDEQQNDDANAADSASVGVFD